MTNSLFLRQSLPSANGMILATVLLLLGLKERAVTVLRRFEKDNWNFQVGQVNLSIDCLVCRYIV